MKFRIHNANFSFVIEAEDQMEALRNFAEEHPEEAAQTVYIDRSFTEEEA